MAELIGVEKLASLAVAKRIGKHRFYGRAMFAYSIFGEEDEYIENDRGQKVPTTGIFWRNSYKNKLRYYKLSYYSPKNPRTTAQQSNRAKMTAAVAEWQSLTADEKKLYNKKAIGKRMSGYNLFLKEYLLSH